MLIVMSKTTHEEKLSQLLQTSFFNENPANDKL